MSARAYYMRHLTLEPNSGAECDVRCGPWQVKSKHLRHKNRKSIFITCICCVRVFMCHPGPRLLRCLASHTLQKSADDESTPWMGIRIVCYLYSLRLLLFRVDFSLSFFCGRWYLCFCGQRCASIHKRRQARALAYAGHVAFGKRDEKQNGSCWKMDKTCFGSLMTFGTIHVWKFGSLNFDMLHDCRWWRRRQRHRGYKLQKDCVSGYVWFHHQMVPCFQRCQRAIYQIPNFYCCLGSRRHKLGIVGNKIYQQHRKKLRMEYLTTPSPSQCIQCCVRRVRKKFISMQTTPMLGGKWPDQATCVCILNMHKMREFHSHER